MATGLFEEYVKGYRADPKGRYGGKDRLETLPTKLDKAEMYSILSTLKDAEQLGMPKLSDAQLANMFLNEGRGDAGFNRLNTDNPKAVELANKLKEKGHTALGAEFAGAVLDKMQLAQRLKKDFNEVWNGTGISREGRTGSQNAERMKESAYAPNVARNANMMSFIKNARQGTLPKEEVFVATLPELEKKGQILGGLGSYSVKNYLVNKLAETDPEAAKHINKMFTGAIYSVVLNDYLNKNNIQQRPIDYYLFGQGNKQSKMDSYTADQLVMNKPAVREAISSLTNLPQGAIAERPATVYQEPWWKDPFGFTIK